jgi:uncharacterized protein (TIGR02147 family)
LQQATGVSSSLLTQIFSENKQLSSEQAYEMSIHLGLTDFETDYFLLLVEIGKSGTLKLKSRLMQNLKKMQLNSQKVASKVSPNVMLTEAQKAIYYSNWLYTAIRNLVPTENGKTAKKISTKLNIPLERIEEATAFLLEIGLLKKGPAGFAYQPGYTHLDSTHPLIFRHHQNWRQRANQQMDHYSEDHLHYTCPMAISKKAAKIIRARLLEEIKLLNQTIKEDPEVSFCLNIDFFEY